MRTYCFLCTTLDTLYYLMHIKWMIKITNVYPVPQYWPSTALVLAPGWHKAWQCTSAAGRNFVWLEIKEILWVCRGNLVSAQDKISKKRLIIIWPPENHFMLPCWSVSVNWQLYANVSFVSWGEEMSGPCRVMDLEYTVAVNEGRQLHNCRD